MPPQYFPEERNANHRATGTAMAWLNGSAQNVGTGTTGRNSREQP